MDRLDEGGTGGHGAGRLRTQPRRFVFSGAGGGQVSEIRAQALEGKRYEVCHVPSGPLANKSIKAPTSPFFLSSLFLISVIVSKAA